MRGALKLVDGVLLYPNEKVLYEDEGWGIIQDDDRMYTSHKDCTCEDHEYGYPSYDGDERSTTCIWCKCIMPKGINALLELLLYQKEERS